MTIDLFGPAASTPGAVTIRPGESRLFGLIDTFFKDCSDPALDDGTEIQAAYANAMLAMIRALARGNGQTGAAVDIITEDNANDSILLTAIQHLIQRGIPGYAADSGAANAITISLSPALAEYKTGFRFWTKINAASTSTTVNININGLGNKRVKTVDGADPGIGACPLGAMMCFEYDGTNFQIISTVGAAAFSLPKATITLAAIGSLSHATFTSHGMTVASSNDMGAGPTISGGNSVVLPAGTYAYQISESVTVNNVVNNTQVAWGVRLAKNGSLQQQAFEGSYLLTGQNGTNYPGFSSTVQVNGTDTLAVQAYAACTLVGDFSSASAAAGFITFQRLGA